METILCINESNNPNQINHYALFEDDTLVGIIEAEDNEDVSHKIIQAIKEHNTVDKVEIKNFEYANDFQSFITANMWEEDADEDDYDSRTYTLSKVALYQ